MSRARLAVAAVVVVALAWGHTGALSMVLSLSVRTTARSSRYSIVDVLRQTQQPLPQPQSPLSLRREVVPVAYSRARGRRAWTMATTSSRSAVILEDRSEGCQRLVGNIKLQIQSMMPQYTFVIDNYDDIPIQRTSNRYSSL